MDKSADFDLVVVGCGPGGTMAGMTAAARGLKVALLERNTQFGRKLCAGAVPDSIWREFELDPSLIECRIGRVRTFDAGSQSWSDASAGWGATVSRGRFDAYLARTAQQRGAQLMTGCRCTELHRESNGIYRLTIHSPEGTTYLRTHLIVLADGFKSLASKTMRSAPPFNSTELMVATQVEIAPVARTTELEDALLFIFDPELSPIGYAWCFPKRHGFTIGVGCVLSHAPRGLTIGSLHKILGGYEPLQHLIGNHRRLGPVRSASVPVRQRTTLCDDGLMLVGDAAGQVAPLLGEGISYAMRAGQLAGQVAAEAIAEGDTSRDRLRAYEQKWHELNGQRLQAQRYQLEARLMAHEQPPQRIPTADRYASFGSYAEIAAQFAYLRYPVRSREELIAQCGGVGRTFVFQGRVLRLGDGLALLPESIFPLTSWSDAAAKLMSRLRAKRA